jgi:hypothetical protein
MRADSQLCRSVPTHVGYKPVRQAVESVQRPESNTLTDLVVTPSAKVSDYRDWGPTFDSRSDQLSRPYGTFAYIGKRHRPLAPQLHCQLSQNGRLTFGMIPIDV